MHLLTFSATFVTLFVLSSFTPSPDGKRTHLRLGEVARHRPWQLGQVAVRGSATCFLHRRSPLDPWHEFGQLHATHHLSRHLRHRFPQRIRPAEQLQPQPLHPGQGDHLPNRHVELQVRPQHVRGVVRRVL